MKARKEPVKVPLQMWYKESFTPDTVTLEQPGSSTVLNRQQVEGWLRGMNEAKRLSDDQACREAVAVTVRGRIDWGKMRHPKYSTPGGVCILLLLLSLMLPARASEIIRGFTPQDGQLLYAADLENLVDLSTIGVQFYNDHQNTPILGSGYEFLVLNPANQTYFTMTAQQILYANTNIILNLPIEGMPMYGSFAFYDPTNAAMYSTTASNFLQSSAWLINVAALSFVNTNNPGATNKYVQPIWPNPISGIPPNGTNYPLNLFSYDTNGIPYRLPLTNLEAAEAFDLGTWLGIQYEYQQEFTPWTIYGTNSASPFTNAFGTNVVFPIIAYNQTNYFKLTNSPTLTDTDTIPVNSYMEGVVALGNPTNTSATLLSVYQYMTNKNALPPYTLARTQFSGFTALGACPTVNTVTNWNNTSGIISNVIMALNWTNPTPVSFMGGQVGNGDTTPTLTSNVVYWAQVTNTAALPSGIPSGVPQFQIFTNYGTAVLRVNPVLGNNLNGVSAATCPELFYVTNFTAVNCVTIQESTPSAINSGVYGIWFTNIAPLNPFYYLTGSVLQRSSDSVSGSVAMSTTQAPATNTVNVLTTGLGSSGSSADTFGLVDVLIQPQ